METTAGINYIQDLEDEAMPSDGGSHVVVSQQHPPAPSEMSMECALSNAAGAVSSTINDEDSCMLSSSSSGPSQPYGRKDWSDTNDALETFRNHLLAILNDNSCNHETRQGCIELHEHFESLTEINLSSVQLSRNVVISLIGALETNTNVTSLDLSQSMTLDNRKPDERIGKEGADALASVLSSLMVLKSLELSRQNFGDEGTTTLARALESNTTLETLDLRFNSIGDEGAVSLARALESENTAMETLLLSNNSISNEGATALANALESNTTLKTLKLGDNSIGSEGATSLGRALESNSILTNLCLYDNSIGNEGATAFARALESSKTTLKWLILGKNSIGNVGATALARALESNTTLETLSLRDNSIDNEGATALARALESNTTLTILILGKNLIGNEGAMTLASALESNTTLKALHIYKNSIGNDGAAALLRALQNHNGTLRDITIFENDRIPPAFETEIRSIARQNRQGTRSTPPTSRPPAIQQQEESNDARKNIIHKRKDLTQCTDSESSLMGPINYNELKLISVIGGGAFGEVWKATWRGTPVAVKKLRGSAQRENVSRRISEEFAAEINMLKGMHHPHICLYMGACLVPPNRAIITGLASNGSLWDALRLPLSLPFVVADGTTRRAWPLELYAISAHGAPPSFYSWPSLFLPPNGTWPWVLVKQVACGAARGMTYLHSGTPPVLHRDLKSPNLLLDDNYTCKVCDFGLSRLKAQGISMTPNCGTWPWKAPEILAGQRYAEPADVYSFGIIMWEMLTAECPYEGMGAIQCGMAVLNDDLRPKIPVWCPPSLAGLIRACWDKEPSKRPTFPQILAALEAMP